MNKKTLFLKLGIGLALFVYLLYTVTLVQLQAVLAQTNSVLVASFVPFGFLLYLIRGYKWRLLLRTIGISLPFWQACKIVLMGTFYGMMTPAKSGELARVYFLREQKAKTIPTVLWDKTMDLFALLLLSGISLLFFFTHPLLLFLIFLFLIGGIILLFSLTNRSLFLYFLDFFSFPAQTAIVYFESVTSLIREKKTLYLVFFYSLLYYLLCIFLGIGVLYALDPTLPKILALALPFIILFGNAPITISGLGLRESASVFAFSLLGASASQGLLFGFLLFLLVTLVPGFAGFFLNVTFREELLLLKNIPGNYYNKHTTKNPLVRLMMTHFHKTLDSFFTTTKAKTVLDVGCGEGYTTHFLKSQHPEISICALDVEENIIALAKQLHGGIDFRQGDIHQLHFPDKSFDIVMANEVLEHLDDPDVALEEIKRVAKKYCLVSVPHEPFFRIANMARLRYLGDLGNTPGHVQNFTKRQFESILKRHFAKVEICTSMFWNIALCRKELDN